MSQYIRLINCSLKLIKSACGMLECFIYMFLLEIWGIAYRVAGNEFFKE